ncbi:hypothetical protein [Salinicola aestuarinus]|uniref:hypothetical protein n=1 Tax=Salinicola aestuarinus TaxID=1949082 RepID=UPI000DA15FEB|nr:hypothetical protein [Salinicola aestuarinus]
MFDSIKKRFWNSYDEARAAADDVAPYYIVGDGIMTARSSEVVRSRTFHEQMNASAVLEQQVVMRRR